MFVIYIIKSHSTSKYRACRLIGLSRSVFAYKQQKNCDDEIAEKLLELADKHKRYGFRKLYPMLRISGRKWNHKRIYRVYCNLGLNLRRKPKKRLPARNRIALEQPDAANISWSLDYMHDTLTTSRSFRTVNLIDDYNREALGIQANISLPTIRIIKFLDDIALTRGYPKKLRVDNGPENISKLMKKWAEKHNVKLTYIQPGKPAQNAYIERFNRTYREEVLSMYLFQNIKEVQSITDQWIIEYNTQRPHQALGNLTPHQYSQKLSTFGLY